MSAWMITASGQDYFLGGPAMLMQGNEPRIEDIAHHLAQINRYTGAAKRPYCVAEHSLLTAEIAAANGASPLMQLACLMHDAHEAYCGDVSSPVKRELGDTWHAFEASQARHVRQHFGLKTAFAAHQAIVHHCDIVALATERRDLTAFDAQTNGLWPIIDAVDAHVPPWHDVDLNTASRKRASWDDWREAFLCEYRQLTLKVGHTLSKASFRVDRA